MLTIRSVSPYVMAETVQMTEVYRRPPLPYDSVVSSIRSSQGPRLAGLLMTTVGAEGFKAFRVSTVIFEAVGFEVQELPPPRQYDLKCPPNRVTELPILMLESLTAMSFTALMITVTVLLVDQVQVAKGAPVKAKRTLQGQVAEAMLAESVGESKVITTSCPLSEN